MWVWDKPWHGEMYHAIKDGNELEFMLLVHKYGLGDDQFSVLETAIAFFRIDIVEDLLEQKYTMFEKRDKVSVLQFAADADKLDILKKLISTFPGIDINMPLTGRTTALSRSVLYKSRNVAFFLLEQDGIDADISHYRKRTPLMLALENKDADLADKILQRSKNIDAKDIKGNTALHIACRKGIKSIAERLVAMGAKSVENKNGYYPLDLVPKFHKPDFAPLFE